MHDIEVPLPYESGQGHQSAPLKPRWNWKESVPFRWPGQYATHNGSQRQGMDLIPVWIEPQAKSQNTTFGSTHAQGVQKMQYANFALGHGNLPIGPPRFGIVQQLNNFAEMRNLCVKTRENRCSPLLH
jgi:hypothetical protein